MHCPNCGTKATESQKFCRSCGFGLDEVSKLLTGVENEHDKPNEDLSERIRKFERWRNIAAAVVGSAMFCFFAGYGIIYNAMIKQGEIGLPLFFLLLLIIVAAMVGFTVYAEELRKAAGLQKKKQQIDLPESLPPAETTNKLSLEAPRDPVLSVTEETTRSLDQPNIQGTESATLPTRPC